MVFSSYIVWYLFLAGAAAGAFVVASACAIVDALRRTDASERLAVAGQSGFLVAPPVLVVAALFLVLDLGSPERAWQIALMPFGSMVSIGAWLVALFLLVSSASALCGLLMHSVPSGMLWFSWTAGSLLACGVMTYTGLLLSDLVAVDFWFTWLLPLLFVVSSLATGLALVLVADVLRARHAHARPGPLWALGAALGVAECAVVVAFLVDRCAFSETARASCDLLLLGDLAGFFWAGVVLCGLLVPLLLHGLHRALPNAALVLVSSVCVLAGGFFVRYCIVNAAVFTPFVSGGFI